MIFYITYDLKTPEGVKQKNILLGGSFTIGGQKLDVHAFSLIQNKEVRGLVILRLVRSKSLQHQ